MALTAAVVLGAARCHAACVFPAARGVLARFAGETVAERFAFAQMEAAEPQAEEARLLPVQDFPEMDYAEGVSYVGLATVGGSVEESGSCLLTVRRAGDVSRASDVELLTVDVSASYGRDYRIDDPVWKTEVTPQSETLVQKGGSEANRLAAAQMDYLEHAAVSVLPQPVRDREAHLGGSVLAFFAEHDHVVPGFNYPRHRYRLLRKGSLSP